MRTFGKKESFVLAMGESKNVFLWGGKDKIRKLLSR
jgi:hypothetical protein